MSAIREQIEHLERTWSGENNEDKPWKNYSYSRKSLKKSMNRYMRRANKKIASDDIGRKTNRKPFSGWEW